MLVFLLLLFQIRAVEFKQECPSNFIQTIHFAGFIPDGYFTRAKQSIETNPTLFPVEVHTYPNQRSYLNWISSLGLTYEKSTLLWNQGEDGRIQILGDSDTIELFMNQKLLNQTFLDYIQQVQVQSPLTLVEEAWKHEVHQAVKCKAIDGRQFHLVLMKDWNPSAFELVVREFQPFELKVTIATIFELVRNNDNLKHLGKSSASPHDDEFGSVLTNGTHVSINIEQTNSRNPNFVAIGYVPTGDLKRLHTWPTSVSCEFIPGGMRIVQYLLAMDTFSTQKSD